MKAIPWAVIACALFAGLVWQEPRAAQSLDPVNQKGLITLGAGYAGSTTEADVDRGESGRFTSSGWGVAARLGLSRRWGAAISYQSVQDREDFTTGETIEAAMVDLHAYVTWLETKHRK